MLSEYEQERQRTIKQNQDKLKELGLLEAVADLKECSSTKSKADRRKPANRSAPGDLLPTVPTRHSSRIAKETVEYTVDDLRYIDDDDDDDEPNKPKLKRQRTASTSNARPKRTSTSSVSYEALVNESEQKRKQQSLIKKSRATHTSPKGVPLTTSQSPTMPPPMIPPTTTTTPLQTVRIPLPTNQQPIHPVYQYPVRPGAKIAPCPLCGARFVLRQDGHIRKHACTGALPSTTTAISLSVTEEGEPAIATSDGYVVPAELFM
jgi:hypothetical protein